MEATLTVLFTDAVASTEALGRLGDERFGVVQQEHLDLLRGSVGTHGGREVKSLGDGLMVAFTGAADALACAVAMQQVIEAAGRGGEDGLPLRVGVSSGDVAVAEDGDVTGTAVVEAARLCAAATGGQILISELARGLAGSRGGHAFTPLGPVELKGLAEPVPLVEVGWAPLAEGGAVAPVPLPPRLAFESSWGFVGRSREVQRIDALWQEAVRGARRVALLGGEPGEGKTRLAREVAVRAHKQGALVLFGRVDEDLAVAYQPFAEALSHYLANVAEPTRQRVLGLRGGVLARLVPELAEEQPQGQVESWAIYEGLVDWLVEEGAQRPIVLVLDDIHWAAKATLGALMHLVRSERLARVLVVGTYRDTELDRTHPLAEALADLRREEGVERLAIRGLDADGVEAFVQAARGAALDDSGRELAEVLVEQTQGNPFFVGQVLRHLAESGAVEQVDGRWVRTESADRFVVPEGVREVIGRRISRLSTLAGELLTVAAVAGSQFDTAIVAQVAGHPIGEALDGFDEAVGSRLVLETDVPGQLRFAHALVRQTLEDELTTLRRVHLHRDLALTIESRFGAPDSAVAELAHHFAEAAVAGEGERAAHYAERAAVQALDRGAGRQAVDLFERALDLLPAGADPDGRRRDELYAQLAQCAWTVFDQSLIKAVCHRWLELGRQVDDPVMRVNAAGWLPVGFLFGGAPKPPDIDAIAEALRLDLRGVDLSGRRRFTFLGSWCPADAPALRARLLGMLAIAWAWGVPLADVGDALPARTPLALADEALRLAHESADAQIIDETRFARASPLSGSPDVDELLRECQSTVRVGYHHGAGGRQVLGIALARLARLNDLMALSDEMLRVAEHNGDQVLRFEGHAQRAGMEIACGDLEEARRSSDRALGVNPEQFINQGRLAILNVGRLLSAGEADDARRFADQLDSGPAVEASELVGVVAAAQGDLDTTRTVLGSWHAADHKLPDDASRPGRLWGLAECAHAVGDVEAARRLYDHLVPFDGQLLVYRLSFIPASAAFTLGRLAETLVDPDRARGHYTDALTLEASCGARMLAARTSEALARIDSHAPASDEMVS
jgi:class 3 adenylate cyclase/tetratricopeptide (TPR) repeat protein